jgi:hypothetical protein
MNRFMRRMLTILVLAPPILALWAYRASVASSASEYQPAAAVVPFLPAGTEIPVIFLNGIPRGTNSGDRIFAVTSDAVRVQGHTIIPPGTIIEGVVDEITADKEEADVRLSFDSLLQNGRRFDIQTEPKEATVSIQNNLNIIGQAFRATSRSIIAAALGASGQNANLVAKAIAVEAQQNAPRADKHSTEIVVRLSRPLQLPS